MNPVETIKNLDENFLFLLQMVQNHEHTFADKPDQTVLVQAWIGKLCIDKYEGIEEKRNRNLYLCKLLACMQARKLSGPFLQRPKEGLKKWPQVLPMLEEPQWVKDLAAESEAANYVGGKDFRTYIATKELDRGRGMCALLNVSIADEGKEPEWYQISRYPGLRYLDVAQDVLKEMQPQTPLPVKLPTPRKSTLRKTPSAIERPSKFGAPVKPQLSFQPNTPIGVFGEMLELEKEIELLDAKNAEDQDEELELMATRKSIQEIESELAELKASLGEEMDSTPKKEYNLEMPTESNMPARLRPQPRQMPVTLQQPSGLQAPFALQAGLKPSSGVQAPPSRLQAPSGIQRATGLRPPSRMRPPSGLQPPKSHW